MRLDWCFYPSHQTLQNVIRNVDVADIPQTLLAYVEFLKKDIEDFTGMTDFATGAKFAFCTDIWWNTIND